MSLLSKVTKSIATFISPLKPSISSAAESDTTTVKARAGNKRKVPTSPNRRAKKIKLIADAGCEEDDCQLEGSTLLTSAPAPCKAKKPSAKKETDRALMPPPSTPKIGQKGRPGFWAASVARSPQPMVLEEDELESIPQSSGVHRSPNARGSSPIDLENMDAEQQARYQQAVQLPENSGIWAEAEKELFYHLALRGFEPLLPANWMLDFGTFPISLFSQDPTHHPLLQSTSGADFRAIRALRSLNEMGKRVRDRALSTRKLGPEPIISNLVTAYLNWALSDAGVHPDQRPRAPPVHAVVSMQRGQSTQDAILEMTTQLHKLVARYRRIQDIHPSIESRDLTPISNSNDETQVANDEDDGLPILTGLMICSSIVVVVTLNAHTVPPLSFQSPDHDQPPTPGLSSTSARRTSLSNTKEESGLRFIATFDFSEGGVDVWNALAVAIVVMHVRKMALAQLKRAEEAGEVGEGGRWEFIGGDGVDGDGEHDPDA